MFTYPSVQDVGIDAVLQSHSSNGRPRLSACLDNLQLEFSAVEPALRNFGGASVARHGVHDVHRAHYLNSSVCLQDGMAIAYGMEQANRKPVRPVSARQRRPSSPPTDFKNEQRQRSAANLSSSASGNIDLRFASSIANVGSKNVTDSYVASTSPKWTLGSDKAIYSGIFSNIFSAGSKLSQLWPRAV
jgi:hypothetical protein